MEGLLQQLLNEVVVTPYNREITDRLTTVCDAMAVNVSVKNIDRHIASFVFNRPDWDFKEEVEAKYAEMNPEDPALVLPPLFAIVMSQYVTIVAITTKLQGRDQATASLILMNYMLYRKGSLTRLILPNHISELYYKLDAYIAKNDTIEISGEQKHMGAILSTPNYLTEHYNDEDVRKEVREMAKMSILYKRQSIIEKYKEEREKPLFVKIYEYLYEIVKQTKWVFLKNDVKQLLLQILSDDEQKKQATIEGIVGELIKAEVHLPFVELEGSSLLLKYVHRDEKIPAEIKSKRLMAAEFGVYIYYELLLENIIGEYYGD